MMIQKPGSDLAAELVNPPTVSTSRKSSRWLRIGLSSGLLLLVLYAIFGDLLITGGGRLVLAQRFQVFVTIFLGIFIEAAPFLLLGSIVSGLIAVFVDQSLLDRYLPRRAIPAALAGAT